MRRRQRKTWLGLWVLLGVVGLTLLARIYGTRAAVDPQATIAAVDGASHEGDVESAAAAASHELVDGGRGAAPPPIDVIFQYVPDVDLGFNVTKYAPEFVHEIDWRELGDALADAVMGTYDCLRRWALFLGLVAVPVAKLLAAVTEALLPHFLAGLQLIAEFVYELEPIYQAALAALTVLAGICYRQGYVQKARLRYRAFRRDLHRRYRVFVASLSEKYRLAALALPHVVVLVGVYFIIFWSPPIVLDLWDNESLYVFLSVGVPLARSIRAIYRKRMKQVQADSETGAAAVSPTTATAAATTTRVSGRVPVAKQDSGDLGQNEWWPYEACMKYWVLWAIVTCVTSVASLFIPAFVIAYLTIPTYWVNIFLAWVHSPVARGDLALYTLMSPLVNPYANRINDTGNEDPAQAENEASNFIMRGLVAFGIVRPHYVHFIKDLWSQGPALAGLMFIFTPGFVTARGALLVGFGFPAYVTMGALAVKRTRNYEWWLQYFCVAVFVDHLFTALGTNLAWWLPLFYHVKLLLMMWLQFPYFRGARKIFDGAFASVFVLSRRPSKPKRE